MLSVKKLLSQSALIISLAAAQVAAHAQQIQYLQVQEQSCPNILLIAGFPYSIGTSYTFLYEWGDGTFNSNTFTIFIPGNKVYAAHTYQQPGNYKIKLIRIYNGNRVDSATISYSVSCKFIEISNYLDNNVNCVYDNGESMLTYPAKVKIDSASIPIDTISLLGKCYYKVDSGIFYTLTLLNPLAGSVLTCASSSSVTIKTTSKDSVEFPLICTSSTAYDLGVSLTGFYRRSGPSRLILHIDNKSCTSQNAVVTLKLDSRFKYKSADVSPSGIAGNTITWNLNNLSAISGKNVSIALDTVTGSMLTIGDTICSTANINPVSADIYPANNNITHCDAFRNSWDPNDKQVSPSGDILPGTRLTYFIRFENLGNDTAFYVAILDTLSEHLDVSTLEMISTSHKMFHHVIDTSGKHIVRFVFEDIQLPYTNSPVYNKGFVSFSIKTKPGIAYNTQIQNRAGIYFDTNPVVLTNYAENRIAAPANVINTSIESNVLAYPNPVHDVLTLKTDNHQYNNAKLLNTIGQTVAEQELTSNVSQVDVKALPNGIYYLVLTGEAGVKTEKIEKQ